MNEGIGDSIGVNGNVDVSSSDGTLLGAFLRLFVQSNPTQELSTRSSDTEEEECDRGGDGGVDTVLDVGEL